MVQRDQREGAKSPENEGVGEPGQRPLTDDFALQQNFRDEIPDAFAERSELEIRVRLGLADLAHDSAEAQPESAGGHGQQD